MSEEKTIGLVVAPGVTEKLAQSLIDDIPNILSEQDNHQRDWQVDLVVDPLTGFAESVEEIFKKIQDYHDKREWDYIVGITDLPMFYHQNVLALDINKKNGAAIFSYPAFGWRPVKNRFKHAIVTIINELHYSEREHVGYDDNNRVKKEINKQFPFSRIEKTEVHLKETGNNHLRYLSNSRSLGMMRLVSGMTFANNPLNMMASLSNIVAIAFTTGAFGLIFSTMWNMGLDFSVWRLFGISIMAILGMLVWIMVSHSLWESTKEAKHKRIVMLYNLTTIMTLFIAIVIYYMVLYSLFLIADLSIPWFATSISTVAGAIGAGLLNDQLIKESTYGYRQKVRYEKNN